MDEVSKKLSKRAAALAANQEAMDRWLAKLLRAANALEKLRQERKRLLKPRRLEPHESIKVSGKDWHEIHQREFNDTVGF